MLTEFEGKIVKSLETIAECLVKQNKMAEEALKKSNQLYEVNMAMMKESQIKIEHIPHKIELTEEQLSWKTKLISLKKKIFLSKRKRGDQLPFLLNSLITKSLTKLFIVTSLPVRTVSSVVLT